MDKHALLDTGAVPNLMSWDLCKKIALSPTATDHLVTVADGAVGHVFGCVGEVLVLCGSLVVRLNFLVVHNEPFYAIIGSQTVESLQENLEFGRQQVTLTVGKREVLLSLFGEPPVLDGTRTDSDNFTTAEELEDEQVPVSFSSELGGSDGGLDP